MTSHSCPHQCNCCALFHMSGELNSRWHQCSASLTQRRVKLSRTLVDIFLLFEYLRCYARLCVKACCELALWSSSNARTGPFQPAVNLMLSPTNLTECNYCCSFSVRLPLCTILPSWPAADGLLSEGNYLVHRPNFRHEDHSPQHNTTIPQFSLDFQTNQDTESYSLQSTTSPWFPLLYLQ